MWLTVKEVAELFDTSDRTIQRRIKDFNPRPRKEGDSKFIQ